MFGSSHFSVKVVACLVGGATVYYSFRRISRTLTRKRKEREHGCQPPPRMISVWDPIYSSDHFLRIVRSLQKHNLLGMYLKLWQKLGVYTVINPLLGNELIYTIEPENVKTILATNFHDYYFGPLREPLKPFLGAGIFVSDGPAWQHSRNLLRPVFARAQLADLSFFDEHVEAFMSRLPRDGSEIDMKPLFADFTMDVAADFLLGRKTQMLVAANTDPETKKFGEDWDGALESMATPDFNPLTRRSRKRRENEQCKSMWDHIDSIIEEEQVAMEKGLDPDSKNGKNVFLRSLIEQGEPKEQLRYEILNILGAGRETTAAFLTDIWFELSRHPTVFARLQKEVQDSTDSSTSDLTFESLKSLNFLRAILNETLRLHPVVPDNGRVAFKDTILPLGGGKDGTAPVLVEKEQIVFISPYAMHRRKDIFGEDAEEFNPDRWLDEPESGKKGIRPGWAYLPFNGGPRVCIGQQFALSEASYLTVRLVQAIEIVESRDSQPWTEQLRLVASSLNGCKVSLKFR